MEKIEFIISEFQKCNIELSQDKADKLLKLYEFLVEYNQNVNLTAITDFEEVGEAFYRQRVAVQYD